MRLPLIFILATTMIDTMGIRIILPVTPAIQGIMSRLTSDDSQGELQGVLSSTAALAMIISPLVMTQVFAAFVRDDAALYLPGAPFLLSLVLMVACAAVFITTPTTAPVNS